MNPTFARKPFSASELVAGSAALAVVALIAFAGLRVPQGQVASPATALSPADVAIASQPLKAASGGELSERSETVGATRKLQSSDPRSKGANLISLESGGRQTPSSTPVDRLFTADARRLGGTRMDNAADLRERLVEEASLWEFADHAGNPRSLNVQPNIASAGVTGLHEKQDAQTQDEPFAVSPEPIATANLTELSTPNQTVDVAIAPLPRPTQDSLARGIRAENTFIGGWADDIGECRQGEHHGAPLVIGAHVAKTTGGECDFRSVVREAANRWQVVARCSREGELWNAHIDLKLAGSNLTWSSERGTETYVRCLNPQYRHDRVAGKPSPL